MDLEGQPQAEHARELIFGRVQLQRQAMAGPLWRETPLAVAAPLIAEGLLQRRRRIFVPGWVRWVHWVVALRSALHTRPLEREQLAAAAELQALHLDDVARGVGGLVAPPAAHEVQ